MKLKNEYDRAGLLKQIELFLEEDQRLMNSRKWDYSVDIDFNRFKKWLENLVVNSLNEKEQKARQDALWMWYHHAVSIALSKKDIPRAKSFADKAMEFHGDNNPNQITRLLYFLAYEEYDKAEEWTKTIENLTERDTANLLLSQYKKYEASKS